MVDKTSHMFITGPDVIKSVTGEEITFEDLGGALAHNQKSGVAHFACESDEDAINQIKRLLSFLPSNNMEDPPIAPCADPPGREGPGLDAIVPDSARASYDMYDVIKAIVDDGDFFEPHAYYAQNMITGFARFGGRPVGIIANQPKVLAGCLDVDAADKACRFIRFCDAFNIPLLTIADVPGYLPGSDQEHRGIIRHGAKLLWCYAEATVPKITLIMRKAYGGAYIAMCSQSLGADYVLAWPTAEIAVMGAEAATAIIHRAEIQAAEDPAAREQEKIAEYRELLYNPYVAARMGYVNAVIPPRDTRPRIIAALEALLSKQEARPAKRHGNIPM
jgi:acetyl-CoA carboxylase carboxyltransferase component